MTCPRCQAENREGRRFCARCGAALALACASCAFTNDPGDEFCGGCGAPLLPATTSTAQAKYGSPHSYTPKHLAEKILTSTAALERQADRGVVVTLSWDYHSLGRACLLLGRFDEARSFGDRAIEWSPHQPGSAAHAQHLLGDIASHADRFDAPRGESHYRQALALAERRGMRPLMAHCHLGLGKLYQRTGEHDQAREHLATATAMYREMDMPFWLAQAQAAVNNGAA
jgi:tetratricopeptide (TPR) repeat protein